MDTAYSEGKKAVKVDKKHALAALERHAKSMESTLTQQDLEFLDNLIKVCKSRGAYRFQYPNIPLFRYTSRSQEYNLLNVEQAGAGRRATIYSFDYSYCVYKDIPTHRMVDSEKICKERSINDGRWLARVSNINQELIDHACLPGKIEGVIEYIRDNAGFIVSDSNEQYFFMTNDIIEADKRKPLLVGKRLRFYPTPLGDSLKANLIEVL